MAAPLRRGRGRMDARRGAFPAAAKPGGGEGRDGGHGARSAVPRRRWRARGGISFPLGGEISFTTPGMPASKGDVDKQVEVAMAALARYHEWINQ